MHDIGHLIEDVPADIADWTTDAGHELFLSLLVRLRIADSSKDIAGYEFKTLFGEVMKREEQGSTFLNEGVAFPHVRVNTLTTPNSYPWINKKGVLGVATEKSIEIVF